MKNVFLKIAKRVISIVYFVIIISIFIVFIGAANGKRPSFMGYEVLRVLTGSMQPTIGENECIIIKKVNEEDINVGDIITFISQDEQIYGMYNTHRVVEITENNGDKLYTTKGDGNSENDLMQTNYNNVVGKYVRKLPLGDLIGNGINALTDNKVYFLVVMLPLLLCMVSYVVDIYRVITDDEEEDEETKSKVVKRV